MDNIKNIEIKVIINLLDKMKEMREMKSNETGMIYDNHYNAYGAWWINKGGLWVHLLTSEIINSYVE